MKAGIYSDDDFPLPVLSRLELLGMKRTGYITVKAAIPTVVLAT